MKFVTIGVGDDGRSKIVETRPILETWETRGKAYSKADFLWTTTDRPFELRVPRRHAAEEVRDLGVPEDATQWEVVELVPDMVTAMHRTDTLDYDLVFRGKVTLELEDGEVVLEAGDGVVIPGVEHRWRTGPEGCILSIVLLGIPPVT